MSATGQGGVTLIAGQNHGELSPVALAAGDILVFTHNVGRRAYQVLVTSGDPANAGAVLTQISNVAVAQATANAISVTNNTGAPISIFVACRWEENTAELDLVLTNGDNGTSDPRIVIAVP